MDIDKIIMNLVEITTRLSTQVDSLNEKIDNINGRLSMIGELSKNEVEQDMRLTHIEKLTSNHTKDIFTLEERIDILEHANGERAKNAWKTVGNYLLVAVASVLISNIGSIIQWLQT